MKLYQSVARKVVLPVLLRSGFATMIRSISKHRVLNVMYHGVVRKNAKYFSPRHIDAQQFENHLRYYRKHFDIVSIEEAFKMYRENIRPRRPTISISFDDGYQNNLTVALPLLEKYQVPSSFFITTLSCDPRTIPVIWADMIECFRIFNKETPLILGESEFIQLRRKQDGLHIYDFLKQCPARERDNYIRQVNEEFGLSTKLKSLPSEIWQLMNRSELKQLSESPLVDIGAHGHMHYNLANVEPDIARSDMANCKKILNDILERDVRMIAFPDGNYNERVKDIAASLGYQMQLAVDYLSPNDEPDQRILNRHILSSTTTFASNMCFLSLAFHSRGFC